MIEVSKKEAVMLLLTIARISSNLLMCCTVLVYFNLDYCQFYYEYVVVKLLLRGAERIWPPSGEARSADRERGGA